MTSTLVDRVAAATPDPPAPAPHPAHDLIRTWGSAATSPFIVGPHMTTVLLAHGRAVVGFSPHAGWAVTAGGVVAAPSDVGGALDEYLAFVADRGLRPVFVATDTSAPYERRGLHAAPVAEEAVIELPSFTLDGNRMASLRHSVASARRAGLSVLDWSPALSAGMADVSAAWLATKRGGEMGFTLGAFDTEVDAGTEARVAVDADGRVVGFVTWHRYDRDRACVLDLMRRRPDAPNPTMDLLLASSLQGFATEGVERASLAAVPISRGRVAERIYPSASLRRYKDKFAPRWDTRWLVVPCRRSLPWAVRAVALAYCPTGLRSALRRNG
jgi:phosphatidylglycerol lysyltransferase